MSQNINIIFYLLFTILFHQIIQSHVNRQCQITKKIKRLTYSKSTSTPRLLFRCLIPRGVTGRVSHPSNCTTVRANRTRTCTRNTREVMEHVYRIICSNATQDRQILSLLGRARRSAEHPSSLFLQIIITSIGASIRIGRRFRGTISICHE